MRCPFCQANDDKVIDSREAEHGASIRRRRECKRCGKRFTTYEHVETNTRLTVIKRDGNRVPFDREKLLGGLQKSAYKRPIKADQLTTVVDEIETELFKRGKKEVESTDIGRLCVEKLKRLDHVAYVRFASVYMKIANIDDLLEEMMEVKENQPEPPLKDQGFLFNE
ncbi:MAG: transcriptional regulator NrdR [Planctomycetota bacterium]